jgi:alpha-beta hydrolase superfamily lysophospholipase
MKKSLKHTFVTGCAITLFLTGGCSHRQIATEPYPIWGEPVALTAADGQSQRHLQILQPARGEAVAACLLIVHGMNEHSGRYGDIARHLADRYLVAGIDMTAHGLSNPVLAQAHENLVAGAAEYDVGAAYLEQARLRNLDEMRDDVRLALNHLADRCTRVAGGPKPLFILSHSLGSLVSASYLLEADSDEVSRIDGIIFTGPAFAVTKVPGWWGWLQNPLISFSFHTHEHFLDPHDEALPLMLFNQFVALITVPIQDGLIELLSLPGIRNFVSPDSPGWVADYLTDSPEEKTRHENDRYIMRRAILRYVLGVQKEIIRFRRNMARFETPYLLIYSEFDPITAAWGNTDFAAVTLDKHPHNAIMPLLGKSHHEQLFSEPELRRLILEKIERWLTQRIKSSDQLTESAMQPTQAD